MMCNGRHPYRMCVGACVRGACVGVHVWGCVCGGACVRGACMLMLNCMC